MTLFLHSYFPSTCLSLLLSSIEQLIIDCLQYTKPHTRQIQHDPTLMLFNLKEDINKYISEYHKIEINTEWFGSIRKKNWTQAGRKSRQWHTSLNITTINNEETLPKPEDRIKIFPRELSTASSTAPNSLLSWAHLPYLNHHLKNVALKALRLESWQLTKQSADSKAQKNSPSKQRLYSVAQT